jgi:hypothetical protein
VAGGAVDQYLSGFLGLRVGWSREPDAASAAPPAAARAKDEDADE